MKHYLEPEMEIITVQAEDIVRTSPTSGGDNEGGWVPFSS